MSDSPDDAMTAYYRSMARNMVPAIYDLFYMFSDKYKLNPYRAYLIGKFATNEMAEINKPENQVIELKHFDDKTIVESAEHLMSHEELSKNKSEYEFIGLIMPQLSGTMLEEADHLGVSLTDMFLVATLVKPVGKETYLRVQIKCYKKAGWSKLAIDEKL